MEPLTNLYKYRHISFDLWLTLIRSNPEFKPKRDLLFRDFFSVDKPIEEVSAVIRKFDILTNTINEKVTRNFNTFEIYYLILDGLGLDVNNYAAAQLEAFYLETETLLMQHKPLLLDDALPVLLRDIHESGKTMNILSNTAFIRGSSLRRVIEYYGLDGYFAFQAYSDETGFSKPGTEMYRYAYDNILKLSNIAKHEVLHMGDNKISDYDGALQFGFDAHLIINGKYNEFKLQPA